MTALLLIALSLPADPIAFTCSDGFSARASLVIPVDGGYYLESFDGSGMVYEVQSGETCSWGPSNG